MRMWMIKPSLLCKTHLLGEHYELHKHLWAFERGFKVNGRFEPVVQIQFIGYRRRHDELAAEMVKRGMVHNSPLKKLPDFEKIYPEHYNKIVDVKKSVSDLIERCSHCRGRLT
jgi:hypothetical protein